MDTLLYHLSADVDIGGDCFDQAELQLIYQSGEQHGGGTSRLSVRVIRQDEEVELVFMGYLVEGNAVPHKRLTVILQVLHMLGDESVHVMIHEGINPHLLVAAEARDVLLRYGKEELAGCFGTADPRDLARIWQSSFAFAQQVVRKVAEDLRALGVEVTE